MKFKPFISLFFVAIITFAFEFLLFSCSSSPQELSLEHENLIGTKWVDIPTNGSISTIEFVNKSFCLFSSNGKLQRINYTVKEDRVIMGNNLYSYVLRENILYLAGYPTYFKI